MNSIMKQTARMFKKSVLGLFLLTSMITQAQEQVGIIPKPVELKMGVGHFIIDANTAIKYNPAQKELKPTANFLASYIKNISGFMLATNKSAKKEIQFIIEKEIPEEGYKLDVSPYAIVIKASSPKGIFYGMQSIFQTLPAIRTNAALEVPVMQVMDYPRFKWRGMHLDVSRHFFGPEMVKEYIDLMASYKINVFHWHLVDDQGWRIEIKKYPKLTEIGAWRVDHTNLNWSERPQAKDRRTPDLRWVLHSGTNQGYRKICSRTKRNGCARDRNAGSRGFCDRFLSAFELYQSTATSYDWRELYQYVIELLCR